MIAVDTNILTYLLLPSERTALARRLVGRDPIWCAPRLWRSEFNNVLAVYLRQGSIDLAQAFALGEAAETRVGHQTYKVPPPEVLRLVERSTCSAYDCEFVALAMNLDVPLITQDRKILREFPTIAVDMETFLDRSGD